MGVVSSRTYDSGDGRLALCGEGTPAGDCDLRVFSVIIVTLL